ncbi:MAG TPA: DUF420 domain-containing protein [Tepidisphaeraceae bacterium]|jgi:uncharacterized membrane protein YozB (DUF420 family)
MNVHTLPLVNATLNGISAVLLIMAYVSIKRLNYRVHAYLTISAFIVSSVFLCLYLYHKRLLHQATGSYNTSTADVHPAVVRLFYLFVLLLPHLVLAIVMVPMILTTFYRAYRRDWTRHRRIAKPTFWIWLYVSVTGVLIYLMLYHVFPHLRS